MNKISFIKILDSMIGRVLCKLMTAPPTPQITIPGSILLIRPGGIGDAILLLPMISRLNQAFPSAKIDILAEQRNCEVFAFSSVVNRVILYDKPTDLLRVLKARYDVVIDTEQWHRLSTVVACLCAKSMVIGFATNSRRRLLNYPVNYSLDKYESLSFMDLLKPLGICVDTINVSNILSHTTLSITTLARMNARELLSNFARLNYIAIFPGASRREKYWGAINFIALSKRLSQLNFPLVIVGGIAEADIAKEIELSSGALNLAGKTSLLETAVVISKAQLVISGDSSLLHLAAIQNIPTVSLFGPSSAAKWSPRGPLHRTIWKQPSCSPCSRFGAIPKCSINVKCMDEIVVEDLLDAIKEISAQGKSTCIE